MNKQRRAWISITRAYGRELRKSPTVAEEKLWPHLRRKQLGGYRFRRQHPVGPYIADFACVAQKLIVEIDGATHGDPDEIRYDEKRTAYLKSKGFRVARYGNEEIYKNMDEVLDDIYAYLKGWK